MHVMRAYHARVCVCGCVHVCTCVRVHMRTCAHAYVHTRFRPCRHAFSYASACWYHMLYRVPPGGEALDMYTFAAGATSKSGWQTIPCIAPDPLLLPPPPPPLLPSFHPAALSHLAGAYGASARDHHSPAHAKREKPVGQRRAEKTSIVASPGLCHDPSRCHRLALLPRDLKNLLSWI